MSTCTTKTHTCTGLQKKPSCFAHTGPSFSCAQMCWSSAPIRFSPSLRIWAEVGVGQSLDIYVYNLVCSCCCFCRAKRLYCWLVLFFSALFSWPPPPTLHKSGDFLPYESLKIQETRPPFAGVGWLRTDVVTYQKSHWESVPKPRRAPGISRPALAQPSPRHAKPSSHWAPLCPVPLQVPAELEALKCFSQPGLQVFLAPFVVGKSSDVEINGLLITGMVTKIGKECRGHRSGSRRFVLGCDTPQTWSDNISPWRDSSATRARLLVSSYSVEGAGIWPRITFLPPVSSSLKLQEPFCTPILHGQAQALGDQCCAHPELSTSP